MAELTKVHFAQSCLRIGKYATQWGADALDMIDEIDQPEDAETVFRFTDDMRRRLRYLDKLAGRAALASTTDAEGE